MTCTSKKEEKKGTCNKIVCYIVGVRSVRGQGLISVHPHDDLDLFKLTVPLSRSERGARPTGVHTHTHTFARVYAVIVTLSGARDSDDVPAKNIRAVIIFPPLTSAFHQEALSKF